MTGEAADVTPAWWLYLLLCRDGRTYVGIAMNVLQRFHVHQQGKGARFTRANRPIRVLGARGYASRSEASKAEHALKKLSRSERIRWAAAHVWEHE